MYLGTAMHNYMIVTCTQYIVYGQLQYSIIGITIDGSYTTTTVLASHAATLPNYALRQYQFGVNVPIDCLWHCFSR